MAFLFTTKAAPLCLLLLIATPFYASTEPLLSNMPDRAEEDLKIGLVLSGGGAKGIAHIGVLEVLEEAGIRVDYISGTSMGSIIGALYSIGYSPGEMRELAESTSWDELFTDRPNRRLLSMYEKESDGRFILSFPITDRGINLPTGLVAGQNIFSWLTHYTWPVLHIEDFSELPIPYATVATDLESGEARVFRSGYLPDAIRASISFPSAFMPHTIDGRSYLDGGLIRNLPVQEVLEMGADYVIAVDVSTPLRPSDELNSISSILTQAVNYRVIERVNEQKELADLNIEIRALDDFHVTDFNMAAEFIEFGYTEARLHLDQLQSIAMKQTAELKSVSGNFLNHTDELFIKEVSVTGHDLVPEELILTELNLLSGNDVSPGDIESIVNQLYSTQLFNLISYRLYSLNDDTFHLEFRVIENNDDSFRFSARYETQTQASILLSTSFRNLFLRGTNLRMNLRLGRDAEFTTDFMTITGAVSRIGINTRIQFKREQIDYFSDGTRISSLTSHLLRGDIFAGTFMNKNSLVGIGVRGDISRFSDTINPDGIPFSETNHHAVYGKFLLDTYNRRSFPTRGQFIMLHAAISDEMFLSPVSFNEQHIYGNFLYPIHPSFTLSNSLYLGRSFGEELPWEYWFSPNRHHRYAGIIRFGGYERYELTGRNIQMISAGIQYEFYRHRFIKFDAYAGNTFDNWDWDIRNNRYRTGFSLTVGALSILGPLEMRVSTSSSNSLIYELQIGYDF
jgi:NTE family protein